ncbi:fimbrial protein [Serratia sp. NPDC078593]|uniref:fimbrial protein n=1 Tax=unclassified Serratia (in: enterobacteria) TaxID=2647522 RepID=UPI0037D0E00D
MRDRKAAGLLCGLLAVLPQIAVGANVATVEVKVNVLAAPPCTINDNKVIAVEFGEVMTTRVDGKNYRIPVDYTMSCTAGSPNALKLQIQGTAAPFDSTVLQTNKAGLGIELQQGSTKLAINHWLNFTYPDRPELWAIPVKQDGIALTGGEFTAGAILKVDYQ